MCYSVLRWDFSWGIWRKCRRGRRRRSGSCLVCYGSERGQHALRVEADAAAQRGNDRREGSIVTLISATTWMPRWYVTGCGRGW